MPSSGKLDYLSKYYDAGRAKKKKKKRDKHDEPSSLWKTDDDDKMCAPAEDAGLQQIEEDGPTVVPLEAIDAMQPQGTWKSVESEKDVSSFPERRRRPRRHDSDNSSSESKHAHRQRQRHDSSADEQVTADSSKKRQRRRRHDSSDEEGDDSSRPPKRRHDMDDEERTSQRDRHDSMDEEEEKDKSQAESRPARRRPRHDSLSSQECSKHRRRHGHDDLKNKKPSHRRRRHDSDDSSSSSSVEDEHAAREHRQSRKSGNYGENSARMSSGHVAGLQSSGKFSQAEAKLVGKRQKEAQAMVDKYGHGDTVYRDASGRKQEAVAASSSTQKQGQTKLDQKKLQEALLNTGRVQQQQAETRAQEWQELQKSAFARHADDDRLEEMRKNVIREGDPMMERAVRKQETSSAAPQRPVYKGPPAKSNRFGIRPGFRWDGVDRGNGFEDKLLAKQYSKAHQKEQAYRWSTADM